MRDGPPDGLELTEAGRGRKAMCGRYSLSTPGDELAEVFGLTESIELEARFNIAPTQEAPIVRRTREGRMAARCRWGLVPYWAEDSSIGSRMINARSETAHEKSAYRGSFRRRRCLVPADGFYEWKRAGGHRQPYYFSPPDGGPMAFAGLWDRWRGDEEPLESYTILTVDANREVSSVHDRMPVILPPERWDTWLSSEDEGESSLRSLLRPSPDGTLASWPVSTFVNSPANDDSRCIEAVDVVSIDRSKAGDTSQGRLF